MIIEHIKDNVVEVKLDMAQALRRANVQAALQCHPVEQSPRISRGEKAPDDGAPNAAKGTQSPFPHLLVVRKQTELSQEGIAQMPTNQSRVAGRVLRKFELTNWWPKARN